MGTEGWNGHWGQRCTRPGRAPHPRPPFTTAALGIIIQPWGVTGIASFYRPPAPGRHGPPHQEQHDDHTYPLTPEQLLRRCDPAQFQFASTADLEDLAEVIGQPRALDAVRFGIGIHQAGYNLFALGPAGVGKSTAVSRFIEAKAATRPVPPDWCYVHNFAQAHLPNALRLPAGWGPKLHSDMRRLLEELQGGLPAAFESDDYHNQRQAIDEQLKKQQEQAFDDLQHKAREKKIALLQTPSGLAFAPLRDGEVITPKEFFDLPDDQQKQIQGEVDTLQGELQRILRQVPQWRKENREQIRQLNQNVASFTTSPCSTNSKKNTPTCPKPSTTWKQCAATPSTTSSSSWAAPPTNRPWRP